jgi:DHA1 family inner membrane transport protein
MPFINKKHDAIGRYSRALGFGGVLSALIFAIVADAIPEERRGAAMGLVMSSLAGAFVFGVPLGVFLAAHLNVRIPFIALAGLSFLIWGLAVRCLPSIRARWRLATSCLAPPARATSQAVLSE